MKRMLSVLKQLWEATHQLCGFFYVSFQFKRDSDSTVDSIGKISINICELKQYKLFNYGVLTKKEPSLENVSTAI